MLSNVMQKLIFIYAFALSSFAPFSHVKSVILYIALDFKLIDIKRGIHLIYFVGMWYSILEFLNVVGVVTNSFLVAFTSQYGRNWESDSTYITVTQGMHNSTTLNATVLLHTITEQAPSRNRLWLIIGFEVKYS